MTEEKASYGQHNQSSEYREQYSLTSSRIERSESALISFLCSKWETVAFPILSVNSKP